MRFDYLLCGPEWKHLEEVVKGGDPVIATAFYGGQAMVKLEKDAADGLELLVRMPAAGLLPRSLPNDPRPLLKLVQTRPDIRLHGDSRIHAKIFVSAAAGLIGSANLSSNGFSGLNEASMFTRDAPTISVLRQSVRSLIEKARPLDETELERFAQAVETGRSQVRQNQEVEADVPFAGQFGNPPFEAFVAWLSVQKGEVVEDLYERCSGKKHNVGGHAYTAYHGLSALLRGDPRWAQSISGADWDGKKIEKATRRIAGFVKANPGLIRGKRSALWEDYLPAKFGGRVKSGGAGSGIIKRLLSILPIYLASVRLI